LGEGVVGWQCDKFGGLKNFIHNSKVAGNLREKSPSGIAKFELVPLESGFIKRDLKEKRALGGREIESATGEWRFEEGKENRIHCRGEKSEGRSEGRGHPQKKLHFLISSGNNSGGRPEP